jgi:signal peptidase I
MDNKIEEKEREKEREKGQSTNTENVQKPIKHPRLDYFFTIILRIYLVLLFLVVLHYGRRIFIAEKFIIPTYSMYPTLIPGDRIMVNKLYHGARLYSNFDFSDHAPMESLRMPGLRKISPGDVVVFNEVHPYGDWGKIEFKINKVFCKRVTA